MLYSSHNFYSEWYQINAQNNIEINIFMSIFY